MNQCEDNHIPKFRVTYNPARGGQYAPVWLVCESCIANRKCFGAKDDIQTMEILA